MISKHSIYWVVKLRKTLLGVNEIILNYRRNGGNTYEEWLMLGYQIWWNDRDQKEEEMWSEWDWDGYEM